MNVLRNQVEPYLERCGEKKKNFSDKTAFIVDGQFYMQGSEISVGGSTYIVDHLLGMGGLAAAWKVVEKESGKVFVLKVFTGTISDSFAATLNSAKDASDEINDDRVQKMLFFDGEKRVGLCDYVEASSIDDIWRDFTLAERAHLAILFANEALNVWSESFGKGTIMHRDLKHENLFFDGSVLPSEHSSRFIFGDPDLMVLASDFVPEEGCVRGTPRYMGPEVVVGKRGAQSDVYSIGQTVHRFFVKIGLVAAKKRVFSLPVQLPKALDRHHRIDPFGRIKKSSTSRNKTYMERRKTGDHGIWPTINIAHFVTMLADERQYYMDRLEGNERQEFNDMSRLAIVSTAVAFDILTCCTYAPVDERYERAITYVDDRVLLLSEVSEACGLLNGVSQKIDEPYDPFAIFQC